MKKLFYTLGAVAAVATPLVAVVSCGSTSSKTESKFKTVDVTASSTLPTLTDEKEIIQSDIDETQDKDAFALANSFSSSSFKTGQLDSKFAVTFDIRANITPEERSELVSKYPIAEKLLSTFGKTQVDGITYSSNFASADTMNSSVKYTIALGDESKGELTAYYLETSTSNGIKAAVTGAVGGDSAGTVLTLKAKTFEDKTLYDAFKSLQSIHTKVQVVKTELKDIISAQDKQEAAFADFVTKADISSEAYVAPFKAQFGYLYGAPAIQLTYAKALVDSDFTQVNGVATFKDGELKDLSDTKFKSTYSQIDTPSATNALTYKLLIVLYDYTEQQFVRDVMDAAGNYDHSEYTPVAKQQLLIIQKADTVSLTQIRKPADASQVNSFFKHLEDLKAAHAA